MITLMKVWEQIQGLQGSSPEGKQEANMLQKVPLSQIYIQKTLKTVPKLLKSKLQSIVGMVTHYFLECNVWFISQ